jgi:hypothetical protein
VEKQVAQKYPGELKINLVGGPQAVKIQDQVHASQTGMVDIVHTTNAYYASLLPEVDATHPRFTGRVILAFSRKPAARPRNNPINHPAPCW